MVVTLVVVGAVSFSMEKMGEMIGKLLTEMGSEHIRILSNINNIKHSVCIKIRSDMFSKLENFEFGRFEIKLVKDNIVPARGIINISHGKEINDIKLKISENDQVSKITNGRNGKSLVVTFKSSNCPLDILGHKISPALKSIFRCNNCQGFGHTKSVCYSNLKCPHGAENHTHNECKSDIKKCANCFGQHSAAY